MKPYVRYVRPPEALKFEIKVDVVVFQNSSTLKPPMIPKYWGHDLSPLTMIISCSPKKNTLIQLLLSFWITEHSLRVFICEEL